MKCVDEPISLYGDWTTTSAQVIYFQFVKCNSTERPTCKDDTAVREWLKNKYLILAYNKYVFMEDGYYQREFKK